MKAAFLDRDGVINVDHGYVNKIEDFEFKEGIFELLEILQDMGFTLFVVTNQSGIARGYYSVADFMKLTEYMLDELKKRGIEIKEVAYCPHHPDITHKCECRKPAPGMILEIAKKFGVDLDNSILIGDKQSDIDAAKNAGVGRSYLVQNSLFDIIEQIKQDKGGK